MYTCMYHLSITNICITNTNISITNISEHGNENTKFRPDVVVHICNSSTQEAKAGEILNSRSARDT
jgi:hypothetical protein